MIITRHTLALLSIVGCSVDVLGSLYLAYDLLGGEHGPLRTLTRAVTYGALFGIGFGLFLPAVRSTWQSHGHRARAVSQFFSASSTLWASSPDSKRPR